MPVKVAQKTIDRHQHSHKQIHSAMMLREANESLLPQHKDPSTTKTGQQDNLVMQPQAQQLALPSHQLSPWGTLDSRANPVARVLDWMGQHELRDDAHSSSSTTVPNDNAEDDTCNDIPVLDAQHEAGSSRHGEGAFAQVVRPSCRIKRDTSTTPSKVECNSSTKCFTKDEHPEPPVPKKSSRDYFLDEETERWDQRQQKSGAVGRLVPYQEGQSPKEDIFLRGGGRHHIILAGLRDGGQAARAGVKVGDRLVSIDGKKDLLRLQAEAIQEGLKAPTVLVFLGFVGKLEAEVRLRYVEQVCGISSRQEAVQGMDSAPVQLCEERVFNVGRAPLFLAVMPNCRSHGQHSDEEEEDEDEDEEEEEESEEEDDKDDESREEVEEEDGEEQGQEEKVVKGEGNKGRRRVHSIRRKRQERQKPTLPKQTVTWRRTPGHSTSWTKHVVEVAPCFELQRSDAHRLVRRVLQTIENGTFSDDDDSLLSPKSVEHTTLLTA